MAEQSRPRGEAAARQLKIQNILSESVIADLADELGVAAESRCCHGDVRGGAAQVHLIVALLREPLPKDRGGVHVDVTEADEISQVRGSFVHLSPTSLLGNFPR